MPYTPDEVTRIQKIQQAYANANISPGDGFSIPLMLAIFARVVKLRDFAAEQQATNVELWARIRDLEWRLGNHVVDSAEVYVKLTPSSEDVFNA